MKPSEKAFEIIKQWEGLRCRAYKALTTEKYYTIGYGHCGPDVTKNQYITVQTAEQLLKEDVAKYAGMLSELNETLEQHQYDALISLIYNIGWWNFYHSMTAMVVMKLNTTETPISVARRIVLWVRSSGEVVLGLQRRRVMEANYFMGYEAFYMEDGEIYEHAL